MIYKVLNTDSSYSLLSRNHKADYSACSSRVFTPQWPTRCPEYAYPEKVVSLPEAVDIAACDAEGRIAGFKFTPMDQRRVAKMRMDPPADPKSTVVSVRVGDELFAVLGATAMIPICRQDMPTFLFNRKVLKDLSLAETAKRVGLPDCDRFVVDQPSGSTPRFGVTDSGKLYSCGMFQLPRQHRLKSYGEEYSLYEEGFEADVGQVFLAQWAQDNRTSHQSIVGYWWDSPEDITTADEIVNLATDAAAWALGRHTNSAVIVAGNCHWISPEDSSRVVTAFSMRSANSMHPTKQSWINHESGRIYYKVLPYFYESPGHSHHRMLSMYIARKPIIIEEICKGEYSHLPYEESEYDYDDDEWEEDF